MMINMRGSSKKLGLVFCTENQSEYGFRHTMFKDCIQGVDIGNEKFKRLYAKRF